MFFLKRSKIVVDAFTSQAHVYSYAPLAPASKFIPQWWRDLDPTFQMATRSGIEVPHSTMKKCRGFVDLYRQGFIMPIWSDFTLQVAADGSWRSQWSDVLSENIVNTHPVQQFAGIPGSNVHVKFVSPWLLKETSGVDFMFMPVTWSNPDPEFRVMPGILNFKHQHSTNINTFVRAENKTLELHHGDPLVHMVPLTEKQVEIRNHLISHDEFNRLMDYSSRMISFRDIYKKRRASLENSEVSKCPFHNLLNSKSIWPKSKDTLSSGPK